MRCEHGVQDMLDGEHGVQDMVDGEHGVDRSDIRRERREGVLCVFKTVCAIATALFTLCMKVKVFGARFTHTWKPALVEAPRLTVVGWYSFTPVFEDETRPGRGRTRPGPGPGVPGQQNACGKRP